MPPGLLRPLPQQVPGGIRQVGSCPQALVPNRFFQGVWFGLLLIALTLTVGGRSTWGGSSRLTAGSSFVSFHPVCQMNRD